MLPELSRRVEKILNPEKSFDVIRKNTKIGGKDACYFFVDGFMKDSVMETATTLQENCGDILADAKEINEQRAAEDDAVVEDAADKAAE